MTRITIDAETRSRLVSSGGQVELCDEQGATVGYFMSTGEYRNFIYSWARREFDQEELDRSPSGPDDFSTQDAITHLEDVARGYDGAT